MTSEASRRNARAQGRAKTRLVASHREVYRVLYVQHGRSQDKAVRALTFLYPREYRSWYLKFKAEA